MLKNGDLLSISKTVSTEEKLEKPTSKSRYLRNAVLVGLGIFGLLSAESWRRNASELKKANQANQELRANVDRFQKEAEALSKETQKLRSMVAEDDDFFRSIEPPYPTNMDGLGAFGKKEAARREAELSKKDAKAREDWDAACKKVGINQDVLFQLKQRSE